MKRHTGLALVALLALLGAGCASHPLGMSAEEWESLSYTERYEARKEQARLDEAQATRKTAEAKLRQELEAERRRQWAAESLKEDERQVRLAQTRHQARYGDVIQCTISEASAKFGKKWRAAQNVGFELQRGENGVDIPLVRAGKGAQKVYAQARFDGLNVQVCSAYGRHCDTLAGSEQAYRRGQSMPINIKSTVKGQLRCSLPRRW